MQIEYREPTREELVELAGRLAPDDLAEIRALGVPPVEGVLTTAGESLELCGGFVAGKLLAVWGVYIGQDLCPIVRPWFVADSEAQRHRRPLLARARPCVDTWVVSYGYLENYVDARHTRALRWLKWLGFTLLPATPLGPYRRPFHRFYRSADSVH